MNRQRIKGNKKQWIYAGLFCLVIACHLSCNHSSKELSPKEYMSYALDKANGWHSIAEGQFYDYELQYLPNEFQVAKELLREKINSKEEKQRLEDRFGGHHYFNVRIRSKNGKGFYEELEKAHGAAKAKQLFSTLSFKSKEDFLLKKASGTQACVLYHLIPEQIAGTGIQFSLVFKENEVEGEENKATEQWEIHYQNEILEPQGVSMTLSSKNINERPKLKL